MISLEYQILVALALDALLGDPRWMPHPIRWIGWLIGNAEPRIRRVFGDRRIAGVILAVGVIGISAAAAWALLWGARESCPWLGDIVGILMIYFSLAARDMIRHSEAVRRSLADGNLGGARQAVAQIVSRDVDAMDDEALSRSTIESVAENLVDGVIAPLFFAAIAGPVGAIAFKAVSTLDSMVGYKNEKYVRLGWASARLDDLANFIPARLTGPMIALAAFVTRLRAGDALRICARDHGRHASPNSAWSEAAFAGAIGIQLGGPTSYGGKWVSLPTLGDKLRPIEANDIRRANRLFLATVLAMTALFLIGRWMILWGQQSGGGVS